VLFGDGSGNSSYEALTASYEHRLQSGLNLRVEYAFAKALTDSWQSNLNLNQISSCRGCSKGPATFDVRQRAVTSVVWRLPFGRRVIGRKLQGLTDAAISGWTLSAIVTLASGQPVILTAPNETGSAFISPAPERTCDGRSSLLSNHIRTNGMLWFTPNCFSAPPAGYFGNSGATVINGPGINNWDVGIQKVFGTVRDRVRVQLLGELFNAWNHAQFGQPNGNVGAGINFGRITSTAAPRLIQMALKFAL